MSIQHSQIVPCAKCGGKTRPGTATGLCRCCWQATCPGSALKYPWKPEWDAMLRVGYSRCVLGKPTLVIDNVCKATGYPRAIVRLRAQRLGLARETRRPWTVKEIAYLRRCAGHVTTKQMAKDLKRSWASVRARLDREAISAKVVDGYSVPELAGLLGIEEVTVRKHVDGGRLRLNAARRVRCDSVLDFFCNSLGRVDLRLCDQAWLKLQLSQLMVPLPSEGKRKHS